MYTAKDLIIVRKCRPYFPIVYKATVISSNAQESRFSVHFEDFSLNRRRLIFQNTEEETEFLFDEILDIFWTITNLDGVTCLIYWNWPREIEKPISHSKSSKLRNKGR